MNRLIARYAMVALSVMGSAILLFSCDGRDAAPASGGDETLMTEYSENLSMVVSQNGRRSYFFETPLLEGYTLAREPYREFRKGVKITTYQNDSLSSVDVVLTANYAIYYENRELWEAKGNVVAEKADGKRLYTQQLFWNAKTKKIYSNVDSKIVQNEGRDVFVGEGFESDEEFKDWRFRRMKGRMEVDVTQRERSDSLGNDTPGADSLASDDPKGGVRRSSNRRGGNASVRDTQRESGERNAVSVSCTSDDPFAASRPAPRRRADEGIVAPRADMDARLAVPERTDRIDAGEKASASGRTSGNRNGDEDASDRSGGAVSGAASGRAETLEAPLAAAAVEPITSAGVPVRRPNRILHAS